MKLEEKLISLRKEKGLSQLKLAEMMNVSRQAVSRWEVGAAIPSTENLKYLGRLYGVSLEYLLHDDVVEANHESLEVNQEKFLQRQKKKFRNIVLVFMAVGVAIVMFLFFVSRSKEIVPMEDIEGSDVIMVDEFEMKW